MSIIQPTKQLPPKQRPTKHKIIQQSPLILSEVKGTGSFTETVYLSGGWEEESRLSHENACDESFSFLYLEQKQNDIPWADDLLVIQKAIDRFKAVWCCQSGNKEKKEQNLRSVSEAFGMIVDLCVVKNVSKERSDYIVASASFALHYFDPYRLRVVLAIPYSTTEYAELSNIKTATIESWVKLAILFNVGYRVMSGSATMNRLTTRYNELWSIESIN